MAHAYGEFRPEPSYYKKTASSGIYGWKKFAIWTLVTLVCTLAIINIALTAWILKQLNFDRDGIRGISITDNGLFVTNSIYTGESQYTNNLNSYASNSLNIRADVDVATTCNGKTKTQSSGVVHTLTSDSSSLNVGFPNSFTAMSVTRTALHVNVPLALSRPFTTSGVVSTTDLDLSSVNSTSLSAGYSLSLIAAKDLVESATRFARNLKSPTNYVFTNSQVPRTFIQCACNTLIAGRTSFVSYWVESNYPNGCDGIPTASLNIICP